MFANKFLTSITLLIGVCYGQFLALDTDKISKKAVVPIGKDYTPTLDDCPFQYYQYAGKWAASSAAINFNFHHNLSHFVVLTNSEDGDFCNGVLISNNWVLTTENCKKASFAKVGFNRQGVLANFTAYAVKGFKEKESLALLHLETVDFKASVSSACLFNDLPKTSDSYFVNGLNINATPQSNSLKVYQDQLTLVYHVVPFVALDVENFSSYIPWIEDITSLNFTPKECGTRFSETRLYEPFLATLDADDPNQEYAIHLNALIQHVWHQDFRASIFDGDTLKCSGVLISDQHMLTTASCDVREGFTAKFVDYPNNATVVKSVRHPEFDSKLLQHDIALLKLDGLPEFNEDFYPACIIPEDIEVIGVPHRQTGQIQVNCGFSNCMDEPIAPEDKVVFIISNVTEEEECQKFYENRPEPLNINFKHQFCSGNNQRNVPGSCLNDYGGPIGRQIYYNGRFFNIVFGLNSHGQDCGCNFPTLATRLSYYREWISTEVGFGKLNSGADNVDFETRAKFCLEQTLNDFETKRFGCNGVFLNNVFVTTNSCPLGNETDYQEHGSIVTILEKDVKPLAPECIWNYTDKVPFLAAVEINGSLIEFFVIFSKQCQETYNVTLADGEFCIESHWKSDDQIESMIGKAVWHTMQKDYNPTRTILFGLVRSVHATKDGRIAAVVSLLTDELIRLPSST